MDSTDICGTSGAYFAGYGCESFRQFSRPESSPFSRAQYAVALAATEDVKYFQCRSGTLEYLGRYY